MIDAAAHGFSIDNDAGQNRDALSAAIGEAGGQTVYVSEGVYAIRPLTISVDHTTLQLAPGAILQVPPDASVPAILNIAANHVVVDGGQFDGGALKGIGGVMAIRIYGQCNDVVIRNCTVRNSSTGIGSYNAFDCENWLIESNIIDTTVHSHGVYLHGHPSSNNQGVRNVQVRGNIIQHTAGNGVWIGNGFADVTVTGNHVFDAGRMGIEAWRNPMGGFIFADNLIEGSALFGVSIAGTPQTIFHANCIKRATSFGIEIANSRNVVLAHNIIEGVSPKEKGVKPTGIALNNSGGKLLGDITITGGIVSGCYAGINLCGDRDVHDHIIVTGVRIYDCEVGIHNAGQIGDRDGGGTLENFAITGCLIRAELVGIGNSLNGGVMRNGLIASNNIESSGNGISLFRPADVLVNNNRIAGESGKVGIMLRDNSYAKPPVHNLLVEGNHIVGFEVPVEARRIYDSTIQGIDK